MLPQSSCAHASPAPHCEPSESPPPCWWGACCRWQPVLPRTIRTRRPRSCGRSMPPASRSWPSGARPTGWPSEARKTRRVLGPTDPYKLYVPVLPDEVGPAQAAGRRRRQRSCEWDSRLGRLRREHAAALYEMARHAVRSGHAGLAFDLAVAAIQADPDYEPVRRLFGYQKFRDQWRTLYEVKKLRAGFVWSEKFGWLPKAHLRRYEEGQRYHERPLDFRRRRRPAASRHPLRLGRRDRALHDPHEPQHRGRRGAGREARAALSPLAADVPPLLRLGGRRGGAVRRPAQAAVGPRAASRGLLPRPRRLQRSLGASMPNLETSGIYRQGRAYFFADKQNDDRTLYHEATHQLFYESRPVVPDVGQKANFWIVEGIAMYMESLRQEDGFYVLGGFDDERMHAAQYRLLNDKFYVPLAEFTAYGRERLQDRPADRHALQPGGRAGQLPGLLRRRPLPRCVGGVPGRRLHGPRRARHACQADRRRLQYARQAVPGVYGRGKVIPNLMRPWKLAETNYGVVKQQHYEVAVLPFGATEPHNLHLPYGIDAIEGERRRREDLRRGPSPRGQGDSAADHSLRHANQSGETPLRHESLSVHPLHRSPAIWSSRWCGRASARSCC